MNEILILSKLRHPNIILYLGHFEEEKYYTVVTEQMTDNLLELLKDLSIPLSIKKKLDIAIEIVRGMIYLHC